MAEENTTNNAQPANEEAAQQPSFQLVRCYLKDASLEMPHAPEIFLTAPAEQPNVDIQFEVSQRRLPMEGAWEVVVRGTITVTVKDQTMFLVEGKQAGIFDIRNIPDEAVAHLTNVMCPTIVYPYLRAILADIVTRTGLPPVHLPEVNFEALYQQRLAQAQAKAQESGAAPAAADEGAAHA